jgi:organic radical activating enzyme
MKEALIISETFYSIQGEGQTSGTPAVFLRLGGCNLLCESDKWRCDTIEVWQKSRAKQFIDVLSKDFISHLKDGAHLVITGGEPLMHQASIVLYLNWFRETFKFTPVVEIETNGTIIPENLLLDKIDYWNVSPKLANSGMPFEKRVNEAAISTIQTFGRNKIFKFVVSCEDDLIGMQDEYFNFINPANIMLMPAGDTVESLRCVRIVVVELCKRFCFRFSDRLHISLWDKKTGV